MEIQCLIFGKFHFVKLMGASLMKGKCGAPWNVGLQGTRTFLCSLFLIFYEVSFVHGERNGNPLQYSCVENLMDRGGSQHSTSYTKDIQIFEKWINRYQYYMYFALLLEYSIQILVLFFHEFLFSQILFNDCFEEILKYAIIQVRFLNYQRVFNYQKIR